jgi:predicted amidohydrolase
VPVFDTDFGRIGVQICFDVEYSDGWDALDQQGSEIFFWLSAYDGGRDLGAKAWQYHRYLASAVQTNHARILNIMGEILAITGGHDRIAVATIDLDVALFHMDFNKRRDRPGLPRGRLLYPPIQPRGPTRGQDHPAVPARPAQRLFAALPSLAGLPATQ